ncbi:MAG TPA: hypothetical protein VFS20_08915 [Longimicrobium sp.]|nr:hypothetical protein [Longimicrobium sp.]
MKFLLKSLIFAAIAITICAHTAAAQRSSPGRQWAAVGPVEDGVQPWMDTTSAVVVGPDRFRVRLMMLRPDTAALGRLRMDRSISRLVYDCAGRTMEMLEMRWMLGDSVVNSVGARASHSWTPGRTALGEAVCQLARRVAKPESAPAGS